MLLITCRVTEFVIISKQQSPPKVDDMKMGKKDAKLVISLSIMMDCIVHVVT